MTKNAIILSIRPEFAKKILDGSKTIELRRVRPRRISGNVLVLLYVTSPVQSLVGAFEVDDVIERPPRELWELVKGKAGISREDFEVYFNGADRGIGISFSQIYVFQRPMKLVDLRDLTGFQPPQGFRYATSNELKSFLSLGMNETIDTQLVT